jgi:hypothetical protein
MDADNAASTKEKFELGLEMLKGYRSDLQDRFEKSTALMMIVVGWLITSKDARTSIAESPLLFWGSVVIMTASMAMYCLTVYNFIRRFREIQRTVEALGYMETPYYTRFRMPDKIFSSPLAFSYIAPLLPAYVFILLILFQARYSLFSR